MRKSREENFMKKIDFRCVISTCVVAYFFLFSGSSIAGIEDRTYERQRLELVEKIESILIGNNVCQSKPDCQAKKITFISPASSGVSIRLYGLKNTEALQQIIVECSQYFLKSKGGMQIEIELFGITKEAELNKRFWESVKPLMSIQFKGD